MKAGGDMKYRWACYGAGTIAGEMAQAFEKEGSSFFSTGNRSHDHAVSLAEKYNIHKVYNNPEDMFSDPDVDIIYIATPHSTHAEIMEKALHAGKHVLCEKSITLNSSELADCANYAESRHLILAEAQTIYHMPLYKVLKERMQNGEFGPLKLIQMNFGSYKPYDMNNRFWNINDGGGAMLEIGVYALSFIRWFMSSCPKTAASKAVLAPNGVDEESGIVLVNKDNELATASLSMHAKQPKRGMLSFDKCYIEVNDYPRGDRAVITWTEDGRREETTAGKAEDALRYEIRDMENAVSSMDDSMYLGFTKEVMGLMTALRSSWNVRYPQESYEDF